MGLQVWLPLNGNLKNQGLADITVTNSGATVDSSGKIGQCYSFDGSNSCIEVNAPSLYNVIKGGSQSFTIMFWIYHAAASRGIIFGDYGLTGTIQCNVELWSDHRVRFYWAGAPDKIFSTSVGATTWCHIALVYDGSQIIIYKNGVLQTGDSYSGTLTAKSKTAGVYHLGRDYRNETNLNGKINDFRVYDYALSTKEIEEISRGLILHYKLDNNGLGNINLALNSQILDKASSKTNLYIYPRGAGTRQLRNDGFYEVKCTASWQGFSFWANALNLTVGTKLTYSFYIYGNGSSRAFSLYPMMFNSAGTRDTTSKLPISCDGENYVSANARAFTPTTATKPEFHYVRFEWSQEVADIISNGGSIELSIQVHGTWNTGDWACVFAPKLEYGEVPTRWSPAPQDLGLDTSIVYDCSGYNNNGQIIGTLTSVADTSKYEVSNVFDGNTSCVRFPFNSIVPDNIFTINLWFKKDALGAKSYETLVGGLSGFEMDTRAGAATTLSFYMASKRGGSVFSPFSLGQWYMVTMVRDGTNELYYVNGELVKTITAQSMPIGQYWLGAWASDTGQNYYGKMSDFRLYVVPLTAAQIKELYETSMSIDNKGNIYSRELVEI